MTGSAPAEAAVDRATRLAQELREREVDVLLVETPINLRYLTGFTGSHGLALLSGDQADGSRLGPHRFLTDFRYATQSGEQVPDAFEREIVAGELLDAAAGSLPGSRGRLGFDEASLSVARHRKLVGLLPEGWQLVPCAGAVERLRAVKEPGEIGLIRAACELADEALKAVLEAGVVGRSERDVAIELELRMRRLGAEAASFPSIVAAGPHAALPHAEPRDLPIPPDVLLTIDWGALSDGYCSDCTRTFATGEAIGVEARGIYALVLRAQEQGLAAVKAGPSGREVDAVAREVIDQAGQGEHFGHGLGHGVGMDIHEAPRLSRTAGEEPLLAGNVVSVEPGVYLPGDLGVRIEDLVVVEEGGCEILTSLPKSLTVVD
ncbi:MAG: aminopeptidase family protein [Solirubrobacterales bacterium]|nr:aminopeptidase family protein [Solirubrobacterales bacterium]